MDSVPFEQYQHWPQLNASLLVHAFKSWRQFEFARRVGWRPKTDTRVGSALHSMVELLPVEKFQDLFTVMPDFAHSPDNVTNGRTLKDGTVTGQKPSSSSTTKWVKDQERSFLDQAVVDGRDVLKRSEYKRALRMLESIQRNSQAMDLIMHSRRELSLLATLSGVECKGRTDGVDGFALWDLKSTADIAPHAFGRTAANLRYVFKMAFYWRLLAANGIECDQVFLIAVQDARPHKDTGEYSDAADCAVYEIPMVAIENQMANIDRLLREFQECEQSGEWPGVPNGDLHIPNWAMEEAELVD